MTQILNVTRNDDGQFEITNAAGKVVEGPFDTNAAAWRALDRIDSGSANAPLKKRKNKKVLWGKPEGSRKGRKMGKASKSKSYSEKMTPKEEHRIKVNAAKAVGWVRQVAAVKFDPAAERAFRDHKLGTFGSASDVKRIDPAVYLAEKSARGES